MIGRSVCLNTFTMELTFFSRNALRLCRSRAALGAESNTLPVPTYPTLAAHPLSVLKTLPDKKALWMDAIFCPHRYFHPAGRACGWCSQCSWCGQCSAPAGARPEWAEATLAFFVPRSNSFQRKQRPLFPLKGLR